MPTTSTALDKAVVCGTAFACACLAFVVGVLLVIPLVASALQSIAPAWFTIGVVLMTLFALPVVGAIVGLNLAVRQLDRA